jgi:hypothetical protein
MVAVSDGWEWQGLALQMGFQYRKPQAPDEGWEVWVYPAVQEIVGGKLDGETGWSGFNLDVSALLEQFEAGQVNLHAPVGATPPELLVEGIFRGREVFLHVCLRPPGDVEATEIIDLTRPGEASVREKE